MGPTKKAKASTVPSMEEAGVVAVSLPKRVPICGGQGQALPRRFSAFGVHVGFGPRYVSRSVSRLELCIPKLGDRDVSMMLV